MASLAACDGADPIVGHVQGHVTVEGEGLSSIEVSLISDTIRTRFTDASGRFSFQVSDGEFAVVIEGMPQDATFDHTGRPAVVSQDGQVVQIDFEGTWIRTSSLTGVVQADDEPVPDIGVSVVGPSELETRTDAEGAFTVDHIRAGRYRVTLTDYDPERYEFSETAVEAAPGIGEAASLNFFARVLPPVSPSGLTVVNDGPYRILLAWTDASSYEDEYRVDRRVGDGPWEPLRVLESGATELTDEGLTPGTLYGYRVRACNDVGCSTEQVEAEARTEQIPPAAPSAFQAAPLNAFRVDISWVDESFNESGFHLERRTGSQGPWIERVATGADVTAFSDTLVEADTEYGYRLRSCNEVGCSEFQGPVTLTTPELPPSPPEQLVATALGSDRIDLTWQDRSHNESHFRLERSSATFGWTFIAEPPANATSFSDVGLSPGTTYVYRILACNGGGCSTAGNEASATTDQTPPPAPEALSAIATAADRVELTWQYDGANETGLHVERKIKNQGSFAELVVLPPGSLTHVDQGVATGTTFEYRVRACNEVGCSAYSPTVEVTTVAPPENNLQVAAIHVTQVVQSLGGGVPLIQGRPGLLRIFVTTGLANSHQPDVRIRLFDGANLVQEATVPAPAGSVPLAVDEGSLGGSWNLALAGSRIKPGLEIQIEVDPNDQVAETNETDNTFPASGTYALDVRAPGQLGVVFVPVRQSVNGLEGDASPSNFTSAAQAMFPLQGIAGTTRATYVTDAPELQSDNANGAWGTVLSEINALRVADGSSQHYYGAVQVSYGGGVAGMGYVGAPAAIGWDKGGAAGVAAHEWGHNFGRRHAPCGGAGNPDPSFPYAGGSIGVWGYNGSTLLSPDSYKDLMGYCGPDWISDYTYNAILGFVEAWPSPPSGPPQGAPEGLLVWGRIEGGAPVLEPAFRIRAPARLPARDGPYRIRGLAAGGEVLFSLSFAGTELPAEAGSGRHFAFVVPDAQLGNDALASVVLEGPEGAAARSAPAPTAGRTAAEPLLRRVAEGEADLTWDAARYPMALVRDAGTGQIVSFARSGSVRVPVAGSAVEVLFSDGVSTVRRSLTVR